MSDDLVTRLRDIASLRVPMGGSIIPMACTEAADEIERLRKTIYALIDELRYNGGYEAYTSKMVFDEFYEQVVRGE